MSRWVPAEDEKRPRKSSTYHPVILKLALLSQGFKISPVAHAEIGRLRKSGDAAGAVGRHTLDIILDPGKVYVGVPVGAAIGEQATAGTPFTLEFEDGSFFVGRKPAALGDNGRWQCLDDDVKAERLMSVTVAPHPHYYDRRTSRGHSMRSLMPMAGDFGGSTIYPYCQVDGAFDAGAGDDCRCDFGDVEFGRDLIKRADDFVETVAQARRHPFFRHGPVFAAGLSPSPDRGAVAHVPYLRAIKDAFPDNWLRLSLPPPEDERYVDLLFEAGADLVGFNYEIHDPDLFARLCPGKVREIEKGRAGHGHYDRMLSYAVQAFGKGHASANLIAGLEPVQSTVDGLIHITLMGAIPTVAVFIPLKGTMLEGQRPPSIRELIYLYANLKETTEQFGGDTYCAGCNRMLVNTKYYDGIQPTMPTITEDDLRFAGLPAEDLYVAPRVPRVLTLKY